MPRPLSDRERSVLTLMIERGAPFQDDENVTDADRRRWLDQVASVRAGRRCGCGQCPSFDLEGPDGPGLEVGHRVVLEAHTPTAMLMLFVDDDRLSHLELAPLGDDVFTEFPDPADISSD